MKYASVLFLAATLGAADRTVSDRFYDAIRAGDNVALQELIRGGADVNTRDARGASPLFYAASVGSSEAMRLLIAAGSDVNARTAFGATPLMWSTADIAKVRLLLGKGADASAKSKQGNTALQIASAQAGNVEVLRLLVEHGASVKDSVNAMGNTPLIRAPRTDDVGLVKF